MGCSTLQQRRSGAPSRPVPCAGRGAWLVVALLAWPLAAHAQEAEEAPAAVVEAPALKELAPAHEAAPESAAEKEPDAAAPTQAVVAKAEIPTLWNSELKSVAAFTLVTSLAGAAGGVAGALAGGVAAVLVMGMAAGLVRFAALPETASAMGIFTFLTAPLVLVSLGAGVGYALGRMAGGLIPVTTPGDAGVGKRALAFAAVDAGLHAAIFLPLVALAGLIGGVTGATAATNYFPSAFGAVNPPSRGQVGVAAGASYALAVAAVTWPAGLVAVHGISPGASLLLLGRITQGATHE